MMYDNADKFFNLVAKQQLDEQAELQKQVAIFEEETSDFDRQQIDFQQFRDIVRKYVGIKELTPTIVNEFIKKIVVHAPDKSSGHRVQKIQIIFNFIGEFTPQKEFIPDKKEFPQDFF